MTNGRQQVINPDIAAALGQAARKEQDRARTPQQRTKARKDRRRNRVTYDLPEGLEKAVERIAAQEEVSKSGAAALLLAHAIFQFNEDDLTFWGLRTISRSPLHEYVVADSDAQSVATGEKHLETRE